MTWYRMERGWMDHPFFQPPGAAPYTEREAWLWLIENAAWAPRRINIRKRMVSLGRGELFVSSRDLAAKWRWSHKRVRGYLDRLEAEEMIQRKPQKRAQPGTHLTICNYGKFQDRGHSEGHSEGTVRAQPHSEPIETKEENAPEEELIQLKAIASPQAPTLKNVEPGTSDGKSEFDGFTVWELFVGLKSELGQGVRNPVPSDTSLNYGQSWLNAGADIPLIENIMTARMKACSDPISSLKYFDGAVMEAITKRDAERRKAGAGRLSFEDKWRGRLQSALQNGGIDEGWIASWGPRRGQPGCQCPSYLFDEAPEAAA